MTEIKCTQSGCRVRISVYGHALFNPGDDPVCAGVSTLTYQLLNCLVNLNNRGMIHDFVADVNSGSMITQFSLAPEAQEEWDIIWRTVRTGYHNLQEAYPENVHLD